MTASLRHAAGNLLVVGLGSTELTGLERAWLNLVRPAGVILFRRNISDAKQTRALLKEASNCCGRVAIRCVDVEGGTVDRLRDALAPSPSAQAVAIAARALGKPALIRKHGELVARSARAFGFNTTLAPVMDLQLPISAGVMGTRVVSASAQDVTEYARNFLAGLAAHDVAGCGKHFPGLGGAALDSHSETPSIRRSMSQLWREDLAPYRELRAELPMVMVSHAAYPDTSGKESPASASSYWISMVLRKRIGYRGIIFSDDLEMGGILKCMPIEEAAVAAVRAGMDLLEICHSPELIFRAYEALIAESERTAAFRKLLVSRSEATKRRRAKLFTTELGAALTPTQFEKLRGEVLKFGETIRFTVQGERASSQPDRIASKVEME